jgi:hypothetical protein
MHMPFCSHCGNPSGEADKFCTTCGQSLRGRPLQDESQQSETAAATEHTAAMYAQVPNATATANHPPAKRKLTNRIGWIAIILILIAGTAVYGFKTVFAMTPKELYLYAEYQNYQNWSKTMNSYFGDEQKLQEQLLSRPSTSTHRLSASMDLDEMLREEMGYMIPGFSTFDQLLDDSTLLLSTTADPKDQKYLTSLAYKLDQESLVQANLYHSPNQTAIQIPTFFDHYLHLNNDEFGKWMRQLDSSYEGPEKMIQFTDYQNLFQSENNEAFNESKQRYSKLILDQLHEDQFILTKRASSPMGNQDLNLRKLEFHLSEYEIQAILREIYLELKNDDELHSAIVSHMTEWYDMIQSTELSYELSNSESELLENPAKMKQEIRDGIDEVYEEIKKLSFPQGFSMTLYLDDQEQIAHRELQFSIMDQSGTAGIEIEAESNNVTNRDHSVDYHWNLKLNPKGEYIEDASLNLSVDMTRSKKQDQHIYDMTSQLSIRDYGETVARVLLDSTYIHEQRTDTQTYEELDFKLSLSGTEMDLEGLEYITGTLTQLTDQDLTKDRSKKQTDITLGMDVNDDYLGKQSVGVTLNVIQENSFKPVSFPSFNPKYNVTNLTESDWEDIGYDIESAFWRWSEDYSELFYMF